ncbi:winged helix DNA-binding domain-containing protein [Streptomyces telluris]|uniref:Winged helix DNA-binding domain-containing protein n=1 Tax=Streptomyces telluris TaxID=2720021 RepID=A0A9X2LHH3_9ACTN|nr:winged helix DNA-binding domain-containing protein [Streptomyces telluris]MCQ8771325.1 winged helix DNA-binding domain-containing protein [Streptomyces telluris]NJP78322.1 winged helix DNA-binding domain-containing protein [Streptomyces telluris]
MTALRRITPVERRARLAGRHLLAPAHRAAAPQEVAGALIGLHATDPATVFLSAAARMATPTAAAIDHALYDAAPPLARIRCMRRTMFVTPRHLAPVLHAATTKDAHRNRGDAVEHLRTTLGWTPARYAAVEKATLGALTARGGATAAELAADIPDLREYYAVNPGKSYETRQRVTAPILGALAAEGRIRRTRPAGSWTSARFRWAPAEPLPAVPAPEAKAALARHYLAAFGPVTAADLKWWTGWTLTDTRKAIAATGAEAVELDEGTGYLLPEDNEPLGEGEGEPEPWVALLPGLDPTSMGWRHRDWYLDPAHTEALFDRNGNIGPTIWADGRIIGAWAQHPDGRINHHLLTDSAPGRHTRGLITTEIQRLTTFLNGTRVTPCYRTPLERRLAS